MPERPDGRAGIDAALVKDPGTWARGRGWALWKALITLVDQAEDDLPAVANNDLLDDVAIEHRRFT